MPAEGRKDLSERIRLLGSESFKYLVHHISNCDFVDGCFKTSGDPVQDARHLVLSTYSYEVGLTIWLVAYRVRGSKIPW